VRQRLEASPMPNPSDSIELSQQLQQDIGPSRCFGCDGTDLAGERIGMRPLLLNSDLLRCGPIMDRYRLTWIRPGITPGPS
jgi:hypothetical protein